MGSVMKKIGLIGYLLLIVLGCFPLRAKAVSQTDSLADVFVRLQSAAAKTRSIASDFVQEKQLAIFSETLKSKGRFFYRQPDQLRWELLTPVASGFVLNGQQGQRWNSLSRETRSFAIATDPMMGIVARQLLAWARVDMTWLQKRYRIELLDTQPIRLKLLPRDQGEAGFIEQLQILFAADRSHVVEVEMFEKGGDKTRLRFTNVRINQPLTEETFKAPEF